MEVWSVGSRVCVRSRVLKEENKEKLRVRLFSSSLLKLANNFVECFNVVPTNDI